jgi:Tfp pilus assembly protein PilN
MSFVQFNLLPDVKLEFNRAQHTKRVVYAVSALVTGIALVIFVFSFLTVDVLQKKLLSDAQGDIDNYSHQLKSIDDLDKILTIQNQLNSLPALHGQKYYASRLFTYLPQLTPTNLNIGKLSIDTSAGTISITGTADTVETINKFVDTLKFTDFTTAGDQKTKKAAFSNVLLSKVDRNDKVSSYTVDASFDPTLFTDHVGAQLIVPNQITTRSVINAPIFNGQTGEKTDKQGGQ